MALVYLIHFIAAVALFYVLNWIGRHASGMGYMQLSVFAKPDTAPAFNTVLRILAPTVFIIILSALAYSAGASHLVANIWVVAPFSYVFRVVYNVVLEKGLLLNYVVLVFQAITSTVLAWLAYKHLILPRTPLFPDVETIGNELWLVIAFFLYSIINSVSFSSDGTVRRKKRYLLVRTNEFKRRFGVLIDGAFELRILELVVYAILVYETFNRPTLTRLLENFFLRFGRRTVGIMQVGSPHYLSDVESVERGIELIRSAYSKAAPSSYLRRSGYRRIEQTIAAYNRDDVYVQEVMEIMRELAKQVLVEYQDDFDALFDAELTLDDLRV